MSTLPNWVPGFDITTHKHQARSALAPTPADSRFRAARTHSPLRSRTLPETQQNAVLPALCGHPDAVRRRAQAAQRKAGSALDAQLARTTEWWDTLTHHNVQSCSSSAELEQALASASKPVVLSFFAAWCSGCRRLHPKLMQIASQNPSVTFIKVNAGAEHMRETCEAMGVTTLPYFILYSSGEVVHRFSLNLSRVATLRTAIENIAQPQDALHGSGNWSQALAAPQMC